MVGSSASPVVLSAADRWGGLSFYSGSTGTLDYVQILRAGTGGGAPGGFGDERAAVFAGALANFPNLSISNSLIKDSFGDGFRQAQGVTPVTIRDTQLINNAGYALNFTQGGSYVQSGELLRLVATRFALRQGLRQRVAVQAGVRSVFVVAGGAHDLS